MENLEEVVENKEETKEEVKLTADEQRAIDLGWKPKDQWQGPEEDWVPAKHWLKYGDVEHKLMSLEQADKQKDKVIQAMKNHYLRVKEDSVREVLETIKKQKKIAIEQEDFTKVAELDMQAEMLEENLQKRFKATDIEVAREQVPQGPPPEFHAWNRKNNWYKYGSSTDEMTVEADTLAVGFQSRNPNASYADVLKYVEDKIKKIFPDKFKETEEITAVDDGGSTKATPTRSGKTPVRLNEAEKAAAAAFGMSEAEYAKEMQAYEKRKGI